MGSARGQVVFFWWGGYVIWGLVGLSSGLVGSLLSQVELSSGLVGSLLGSSGVVQWVSGII